MKLCVLCTIRNDFGRRGYYNTQEIGLGRTLARQGHEVIVYKCLRREKQADILHPEPNLTVYYQPIGGIGAHGYLDTSLLPKDLDGILYFSDHQIFYPHVLRYCRKNNIILVPYVGTTHSIYGGMHSRAVNFLYSMGTRRAYRKQLVLAKSEGAKQELAAAGIANVQVAHVGLDFAVLKQDFKQYSKTELRKQYGYAPDDVIVLNVARFHPEKRAFTLLDIFNQIKDRKKFKLLFVGEGPLRGEVDKKIEALGLEDRVRIYERIPYEKMWEIYRIADYFANLNLQEIFGMAIMEAVYYEVPVVASVAPGPSLILDGMEGHRLCTQDEQISDFLAGEYPCADKLERSAAKLRRDLGWEQCAQAFVNIVERGKADGRQNRD